MDNATNYKVYGFHYQPKPARNQSERVQEWLLDTLKAATDGLVTTQDLGRLLEIRKVLIQNDIIT